MQRLIVVLFAGYSVVYAVSNLRECIDHARNSIIVCPAYPAIVSTAAIPSLGKHWTVDRRCNLQRHKLMALQF